MKVDSYSVKYRPDVVEIVKNFYNEALSEYNDLYDPDALMATIDNLEHNPAASALMLLIDGKCEGILVGLEIPSLYNKKRIYQELIWYVNPAHRKYGVFLLNKAQEALKAAGFNLLIMAVMENSKTEAIKKLYSRVGFTFFESHWIKEL